MNKRGKTRKTVKPVGIGIWGVLSKIDFRIVWYSSLLWLVSTLIGGLVVLPWFYIFLAVFVFIMTVITFSKIRVPKSLYRRRQDKNLIKGLWIGLFWSAAILVLDFSEFNGFSVSTWRVYFSDSRSWFKYPLFILIPIIYALILENAKGENFSKTTFLGYKIFPE